MTIYDKCFPLGIGTTHFPIRDLSDEAGIEQTANWILHALDKGVNYIDVGHHYSNGTAETVLKHVFAQTKRPYYVTVKSEYGVDKNADGARRRVETSLSRMGIDHADFFLAWTIRSLEEFKAIMKSGGIYDAALKMKDDGIISHICFSTHAPQKDIIQILESEVFEGITVSYSLLNSAEMRPVLDVAHRQGIGAVVMNPLGGGIIPQNKEYFDFARNGSGENGVQAALRFAAAHPAVKVVLSGVASMEQLEENLTAFTEPDLEPDEKRIARLHADFKEIKDFCTGCRYCDDCPEGIPIPAIMQSRNALLFKPVEVYHRTDLKQLYNIQLFRKLEQDFSFMPDTPENPCIRCGHCEAKCTQALEICDAVDDVYKRATATGFSLSARKTRLDSLLNGKGYKKVGLYPNGGYANKVLELYRRFFGEPEFEILQFNSDPRIRGTLSGGLPVHAPEEIPSLAPDAILVCSYRFGAEICESLRRFEMMNIKILELHNESDVPWVY